MNLIDLYILASVFKSKKLKNKCGCQSRKEKQYPTREVTVASMVRNMVPQVPICFYILKEFKFFYLKLIFF